MNELKSKRVRNERGDLCEVVSFALSQRFEKFVTERGARSGNIAETFL